MKRARSTRPSDCPYVTKGGLKLEFALDAFNVNPNGCMAGDFGCHRGGFTHCLLLHGARHVHAIDTAYGVLDWSLRNDSRVTVHERTNLLHWTAPTPLDMIVLDTGWTPQHRSVPAALQSLNPNGTLLSLVKPQYEASRSECVRGVLRPERIEPTLHAVRERLSPIVDIVGEACSPLLGSGGNVETWLHLRPR